MHNVLDQLIAHRRYLRAQVKAHKRPAHWQKQLVDCERAIALIKPLAMAELDRIFA